MKLQNLVNKNKIVLSKETMAICRIGLRIMRQTKDPAHDKKHIESIFDNLDHLLQKSSELKTLVNFNVLLPAICWHDSWKSLRSASNPFNYFYHQLVEGVGSARIFYKKARQYNIEKKIAKAAAFVIRKHSLLQFLPTKRIEVKILLDLDGIEMWDIRRISTAKSQFVGKKQIYKKFTKLFFKVLNLRKLHFKELEDVLNEYKVKYEANINSLMFGGR